MQFRLRGRRFASIAIAVGACALVAACGSSTSNDPNMLLRQTFTGAHKIDSGNLRFALTVTPSGSSTLRGPITLTFGGPFQSRGKGKLPQSNFNIAVSAQGKSVSLGIISTGTAGYVSLQGTSYQLPQATFQRLEQSFSQTSSSSSSQQSTLSKLGIQPLNWLTNPTIVGHENIGGADTTHIRAGVNVNALVNGLSQFLQNVSSVGVTGTSRFSGGLSPSAKSKVASEIQSPTFDVWTGNDDKTLRRLQIGATVPVSGRVSSAFGGLSSANVGMTIQYSNLNQHQTISAPSNVQPYSQFQAQLQQFLAGLEGGLGGLSGGGGTSGSGTPGGTSGGGTSSPGASSNVAAYTQCIQAAGNDVTKLQQCAALLGSSSSSGP
jgi:hypothetical protein